MHRREFIATTVLTTGSLLTGFGFPSAPMTVQQVIDTLLKDIPGAPFSSTVDTIKAGSPDMPVKGIVTTMFATMDVIRKAAELGANFIIAHEPTYYNHGDSKKYVEKNAVMDAKIAYLDQQKIAVWRFHDYCHALKPDPMAAGIAKKCGWMKEPDPAKDARYWTIPAMTLSNLADHLKKSLGITTVRIIGDLKQNITNIALLPGAWGGQNQINASEQNRPDVMIVGEVHEWETAEYIRDSRLQGKTTSLIILGHSVSEEPGMEYVTDWLKSKLTGMKITHVASGDPFVWR